MRLAFKLTLVWVLAITLVLVLLGTAHMHRVSDTQREASREELAATSAGLADAAAHLWGLAGRPAAERYLRQTSARGLRTRVFIERDDGLFPAREEGAKMELTRALSLPSTPQHPEPTFDGERWLVQVPLPSPAPLGYRLRVERPAEVRAGIDAQRREQLVILVMMLVLCALVSLVLGMWMVGRPVEALVAQARRVASGDFRVLASAFQKDEIGHLAREMDRMSEQLGKARARERKALHTRTELQEQLRHADRLSTVGKIASGVAHELGTPLNVISGRASMIVDDDDATDEIRENAVIVHQQSHHMAAIIRQLLDFSRRKALEPARTDLRDLVEEATSLLDPIAEERGVQIESRVSAGIEVVLDRHKILQVLTNMMMNGIHAMPEGGPLLLSASIEHVLDPPDRRAREGDYVCIAIEDRGAGMPEDVRKHIFQPFFTTKQVGKGTGLGLSVCDGIVRDHGGFIGLSTEMGQGTVFQVYLPMIPA